MERRPGFAPEELKPRYDVETIVEDAWHAYSGQETARILADNLPLAKAQSKLLLNAGAGIYQIRIPPWEEVSVDLFPTPLRGHPRSVCATVEQLPFPAAEFGAIVCVGEVLGYCDPARAIAEFSRVLAPRGLLICDFGNSGSARHWFTPAHSRTADMIVDMYNGTPERIWVYDPAYIQSVLRSCGFEVLRTIGTHTWSAVGRKLGLPTSKALGLQSWLRWLPFPTAFADLTTIAAVRSEA